MATIGDMLDQAHAEALAALEDGRGLDVEQARRVASALFMGGEPREALVERAATAMERRDALSAAVAEFAHALIKGLASNEGTEIHLIVPRLMYWDLSIDLGHRRAHVGGGPLPEHSHFGAAEPFVVHLGANAVRIACDDAPDAVREHTLRIEVMNIGSKPLGNWLANAIPPGADLRGSPDAHAGVDRASALTSLLRVLASRILRARGL